MALTGQDAGIPGRGTERIGRAYLRNGTHEEYPPEEESRWFEVRRSMRAMCGMASPECDGAAPGC